MCRNKFLMYWLTPNSWSGFCRGFCYIDLIKWAETSYLRNINCVVHDGTLLNIFINLSTTGMCHLNTELLSLSTVRAINYGSDYCVKQCQTCFTPPACNRTSYDLRVGVCSCMHFTYWRDPGLKVWCSEWIIKNHKIF
jgi:hypothetical protein